MEQVDHKPNHKCKFCRKMFPCGRSLGGHMRSHLITSNDEPSPCTKKKKKTKKRSHQRYSDESSLDLSEQEEVAFTLILLSMDSTNSDSNNHNRIIKSNWNDQSEENKFRCMICNKAFSSYQALGGHRASHKKFKGCCAPTTTTTTNPPHNLQDCKKSRDHECPICFKIFPSGQALGGHKRSHLITDQPKINSHLRVEETQTPQVRRFLDLNLPAPAEEECSVELKPWWIGAARPNLRLKCV